MYLKTVNNLFKLFLLLILLASCYHSNLIIPVTSVVDPNRVHDFKLNKKINIVNIHPSKTNIQEVTRGVSKRGGNLYEWTDKAIILLKSELEKRGGEISEDGLKVLSLSVSNAHVQTRAGGSGTWCKLTLHVETGDGYSTDILIVHNAGIGVDRPVGYAITLAITDLLNDENILHYLR